MTTQNKNIRINGKPEKVHLHKRDNRWLAAELKVRCQGRMCNIEVRMGGKKKKDLAFFCSSCGERLNMSTWPKGCKYDHPMKFCPGAQIAST